jgi:hypothetical protein
LFLLAGDAEVVACFLYVKGVWGMAIECEFLLEVDLDVLGVARRLHGGRFRYHQGDAIGHVEHDRLVQRAVRDLRIRWTPATD